jgi:hypothetical protein
MARLGLGRTFRIQITLENAFKLNVSATSGADVLANCQLQKVAPV